LSVLNHTTTILFNNVPTGKTAANLSWDRFQHVLSGSLRRLYLHNYYITMQTFLST